MAIRILLTGFGPFPGAPFNPTGPLVEMLARGASASADARRVAHVVRTAHVFRTAYAAVDRELPALIARDQPDVLVMFGLAQKSRQLRIETQARNALTRVIPDVGGTLPPAAVIVPDAPDVLALRAPAYRMVRAARATGMPAALSRDAGRYLCNYLCWRACEAARSGGPRLVTLVHVPPVDRVSRLVPGPARAPFALEDLVRAGEAIVRVAAAATALR